MRNSLSHLHLIQVIKMRTGLLYARFLTLLGGLALCGGCGSSNDPNLIRIVSSLPRTGSSQGQTDSIVNGIKMALEEANYRVGEFKIEYLDLDDATASAGQWEANAEIANANQAARDPNVMVYIGTYNSGAAVVSMPILNQAGLLMISPANTSIGLTKPSGRPGEPEKYRPTGKINYVRVVATDDLQGALSADWAQRMGVKKVYVLDDNETYGKGVAELFAARCEEIGIQVLAHEHINAKATDFKSTMNKIKSLSPDLVYFGGTTQSKGGQIAKDMRQVGLDCKLMVPEGCMEDAFISAAGPENVNDRCFVTFPGLPAQQLTGTGKEFYEKYKARYKIEPEPYAVYGYEAGKVALTALKNAGKKDRAAVVDACLAIKGFDGALGVWSFDKNGDTSLRRMSGYQIRNGKFEFVTMLGDEEHAAQPADSPETAQAGEN
jgi:branched-chain amino acid transport system substrate-binding protein